ncbi:MAG: cysteine peptidase family C39 domain-containing protein [Planctomycetia bacterium]|nr:cysteine peptidase family C39 domain-containing protein [Planctomycetia bacterium]
MLGGRRQRSATHSQGTAARRYALRAKGYSKDVAGLKGMTFPVIVFWKFNHFLVVEGFSDTEVFLNDPAYGHTKVGWAEFEEGFTSVVLAFEPDDHFKPGGQRRRVRTLTLPRRNLIGIHDHRHNIDDARNDGRLDTGSRQHRHCLG